MPATLSLGQQAYSEVTTSDDIAVHNAWVRAGDNYRAIYYFRSKMPDGLFVPLDMGRFNLKAQVNSKDYDFTLDMTLINNEGVPGSGVKDVVTITMTPAQTVTMDFNDRFVWGLRAVDKIDATKVATIIAGDFTVREQVVI